MNTTIEARIARVARVRGITFFEAAAVCARAGARRKWRKARDREALTRLRATWAWKEGFE
jgi:hypothetical protein